MENKNSEILTYIEKAALDGEIAFALSTCPHNDEVLFRVYLICKELEPKFRPYVINSIKSMTTCEEEMIDRVVLELENEEPPLWLWLNKCVSDLKLSLKPAELTFSTDTLNVDKKLARENLITSSFIRFVEGLALCYSPAATQLCQQVQECLELSFLQTACFYLLEDIRRVEATRPPKSKVPSTILAMNYEMPKILSFMGEKERLENKAKGKELTLEEKTSSPKTRKSGKELQDQISKAHSALDNLAEVIKSVAEEVSIVSEDILYVVSKTFKESHLSTPLRTFDTEEEAIRFIESIKESFPELEKTCEFTIATTKKKKKESD